MRGRETEAEDSRFALGLVLCIGVAALAFRLTDLDLRPFHADEANQAVKTGNLLEGDGYRYDPTEHHGPTLYYLGAIPALLQGKTRLDELSETDLRVTPAVFSAALILLLLIVRKDLGPGATVFTALLFAVSPTFVFFGRYYIQETLLIFATLGAVCSGWRFARSGHWSWALATGAFLGFMHATKETAVIAYLAMAVGALAAVFLPAEDRSVRTAELKAIFRRWQTWTIPAMALAVTVLFYSSFLTHPAGIIDAFRAYPNYLQRADGAGMHDKPWSYYFGLLAYVKRGAGPWWSQAFILLMAVAGAVVCFTPKAAGERPIRPLGIFLVAFTGVMVVVYSAIPYKTPWLVLNFLLGPVLLAGIGMAYLLKTAHHPWARTAVVMGLMLGFAHLARQSYLSEFKYYADVRNPSVYAHTSTAFVRMIDRIRAVRDVYSADSPFLIRVIQPDRDYWPLPWYLRDFDDVGYWEHIPDEADAPVIVIPPALYETLEPQLRHEYTVETYSIRPAVLRLLLIREDLWQAYMSDVP